MKNKALIKRLNKRLQLTNSLHQLNNKTANKQARDEYKPLTTTPTKIIQG